MVRLSVTHFLPAIRLAEGGVTRAVIDLATVLAARGHAITVLTSDAADAAQAWKRIGDRFAAPSEGGGAPTVPMVLEIRGSERRRGGLTRSAIERFAPFITRADVLHLHGPWTMANVALARLARRAGVPDVLTLHGMLDDWSMGQKSIKKRLYLAMVGNTLIRQAASIHCTAAAEEEQARRWIGRTPTAVIPYLIDLKPFEQLPGAALAIEAFESLRRPVGKILFLSRLHPKKGVETLLEAGAELARRGRDFVMLIAGPGEPAYVNSLRRIVEDLGLGDRVEFVGLVSGKAKVSLYQAADVFVLPTSQENFGLVLAEAMACGTPVVTTKGVDIWRELAEAGAKIVSATPTAVADAVSELLDDEAGRRALGQRAREWVNRQWNPEALARRYEQWYGSVARGSVTEGQ